MAGKFSLASRSNEILSPNNMTWCLMPDTRLRLHPTPFAFPNLSSLSPVRRPSLIRFPRLIYPSTHVFVRLSIRHDDDVTFFFHSSGSSTGSRSWRVHQIIKTKLPGWWRSVVVPSFLYWKFCRRQIANGWNVTKWRIYLPQSYGIQLFREVCHIGLFLGPLQWNRPWANSFVENRF